MTTSRSDPVAGRLREQAARLEMQARELFRLADELDGARPVGELLALPAPAPTPAREDLGRLVGISAATQIAKLSENTIYRAAHRYGVGWRLQTGGWKFSETRLRRFVHGDVPNGGFGEPGGIGEPLTIDPLDVMNHIDTQR